MIFNKKVTVVGKDIFGMVTIYVIQVNLTREICMRGIVTGLALNCKEGSPHLLVKTHLITHLSCDD